MPAKSGKQLRFMYAASEGKIPGVPESVGKEFVDNTPKKKKSLLMKAYHKDGKK